MVRIAPVPGVATIASDVSRKARLTWAILPQVVGPGQRFAGRPGCLDGRTTTSRRQRVNRARIGSVSVGGRTSPTERHTMNRKARSGALLLAAAAVAATVGATGYGASAATPVAAQNAQAKPVNVEVFSPEPFHNAGIQGAGWFVDAEITFHGKTLQQTGFTGLQLTGPGVHANAAPFPGAFSTGHDDRNPGLVVLTSTTVADQPGFTGPGTNLANLFNLTGVTDRSAHQTELWDTWIVGKPIAGQNVNTTLTVAEVADLNHDGIYNDAPDVVTDRNHDGRIDAKDLRALGVASNIVTVPFHISGAGA
jgi:hypothetical protein